jgi:hypothetical protein
MPRKSGSVGAPGEQLPGATRPVVRFLTPLSDPVVERATDKRARSRVS